MIKMPLFFWLTELDMHKCSLVLFAAAILCLFTSPANSQSDLQRLSSSQDPTVLVERMLQAESSLALTGDQVTTLYRSPQPFTAQQTISRLGANAFRLEYTSPAKLAGEIYSDNGHISWSYLPSTNSFQSGQSQIARIRQRLHNVVKLLLTGRLTASLIGQDTVADIPTVVIRVSAPGVQGERHYWIDPTNGAQLKIQTYGPQGQLLSETYYSRVTYGKHFPAGFFDPPITSAQVQNTPGPLAASQMIQHVPSAAEVGFPVMQPAYVPPGFSFQSAQVQPMGANQVVSLRYANGLTVLSIYEYQLKGRAAAQPDEIDHPRQGVCEARTLGHRFVVIGNLAYSELDKVAASMH